jgi:DDE superfamily endonuclease
LTRWYARDFDFVSLNQAAILHVIPPEPDQALVIDASVVPKSGKTTSGLDRCWNGRHSRPEKGLAISALAWLDITDNCAYCLRADQTPGAEATRMDVSRDQVARVVSAHHLRHLRYVITDGSYSKQQCLAGVRALGREQIGTLRLDANLRSLSQGPHRPGPGRPQTDDGKGYWDTLSRVTKVETDDEDVVRYHQVLNQVPFQCNRCVVRVVDTTRHRKAGLFSTDLHVDALTIYRDYQARFHIEIFQSHYDSSEVLYLTAA